jgi:AraC-like DNA-binding protein
MALRHTPGANCQANEPRFCTIIAWHRKKATVIDQPEEYRAYVAELRTSILAELASRKPSMRRAAELSGVSVRTLQRRLAAAGTTYSQLVQEIRHDAACKMLRETDMPLKAIAAALGYSELSAFSRAFYRWTGRSPHSFRTVQPRHRWRPGGTSTE